MSRSLVLAPLFAPLFALLVPACSASEAAAPPPVAPGKARSAQAVDARAVCVDVFTHNRTCTAQYIPALVDLRAKYDVPAGIAAEVAAHRDQVIAQANEEWATDSQPAAIDATCTRLTASLSDADRADLESIQACLSIQDCGAYTACVMPYFEKRFTK